MARYITSAFEHVETTEAYGYTFFFYRDERVMPFATMIAQDTEHDRVSNLDRPGVYRLNIGVEKATFRRHAGDATAIDHTAVDQVMPHPEYAAQSWLCVLAPSDRTFERDVKQLLDEAYRLAKHRYERRG
jgi:hypothetical protein